MASNFIKRLFISLLFVATIPLYAQNTVNESLAYQYYQQGDYEKAAPIFEKLFNSTRFDNYFEFYFTSLIKIKKYTEAESLAKKLIKQNPQKTSYLIALGRLYQDNGRNDEANKIYLQAIKNLPKNEFNVRELANSFFRFEAYDMAINTFLQGRNLLNDESLFTYDLLSIYRFKKDKNMLVQEYVNALGTAPQLLQQAESVLASVFESNSDYQLLQTALLKKIQKQPDVEVYTELLIWQFMQQQQYDMALRQVIAFDKRTKSNGLMVYNVATTFVANKAFATAQKAFEYLLTKGADEPSYLPAKIQLVNVKYEQALTGNFDKPAIALLANEFETIITQYGITSQTLFAIKKLAQLQAYYLNNMTSASATLEKAIAMKTINPNEIAQLKLDLGDIYLITNQPWDAVLIYEQVAKQFENQQIGQEAQYKSAKLSFYQGNFKYAKSQVDVLKASTSQLISNDALNLSLLISDNLQNPKDSLSLKMYADAELLQFLNQDKKAVAKLDSINIKYPNNSLADDILMAKSKMAVKGSDFEQASAMLKLLIANHAESIWIDDALFLLADLEEHKLNHAEEAKKLYQQLITDFPGSMYNAEARKRFRTLRGDNLGT
jgi:predicted Zn-dependent protease